MTSAGPLRATVVTPLYNARDYIRETVDSVLAQADEENAVAFQYIVVDDGSTDGSGDLVAQAYGDRLTLIRQPNQGEVAAVNAGVAAAATNIVAIVNADDPIRPGLIRAAVHYLEQNPDVVAAYPDWLLIDGEGRVLDEIVTDEFDLRRHLEQHFCIPGPGGVFRKSALAGEPARQPRFRYTSDYDMWARLALRGEIRRIPQFLATWRTHAEGASIAARSPQMAANKIEMISSYFDRSDIPRDVQAWRRQSEATALYSAGLLAIHDERIPGRRYLLRSLLLAPFWPAHFRPDRQRSWLHIAYVIALPVSRWLYNVAVRFGLVSGRHGLAGSRL